MPYKSKKKRREYMRKYRAKDKVSVNPVNPVNPKPRRGRKTKLTSELHEQIVKYVEAGNYNKVACQAVDISEVTYYDWLKRGEAGEEPFLKFLKSIRGAEARAEIRNVTMINIAAKKDWRAALEMLARKYHKRWGLKKQIEGIGEEPLPVPTVNVVINTEKQCLEIIDKEVKATGIKPTKTKKVK